jgi:signal transduction histidine kinase
MIPTAAVASADVLRVMAHELRQPLSTIESIAYYLTLVLPKDDEKVHEQLNRIQQLVEQSNWIVTSAQQLAEPIGAAAPDAFRIDDLIYEIVLERSPLENGPAIEIEGDLPFVNGDRVLARAMIGNLLMLFRAVSSPAFPAKVYLRPDGAGVLLELATGAPGYKSETSLGPGATLSLDGARRIVAAHNGWLKLEIDPANGIRLRVMLP